MAKTNYNMHLKGYVGGGDFDRDYVDYVLSRNEGKEVNVLIDSLGGSMSTALSIAAAFRQHGNVNAHFVGMNASAATIASLGARKITIDRNAMYLVHKCAMSFFEWGSLNADEFRRMIEQCQQTVADLDKLDLNVASMYAAKCRKDPKSLLGLMKVGGWLTAAEALDWGFVDEVTDYAEPAPTLDGATAQAIAAAGMPVPQLPLAAEEQPLTQRILAALAALFRRNAADPNPDNNNDNPQPPTMNKTYKTLCELLAMESLTLTDNAASLTDGQLTAIDDALAERIALLAEVEALKAAPAEPTTTVVATAAQQPEKSPAEQFCETYNNARRLFDEVRP